jgi:hypothetical protein
VRERADAGVLLRGAAEMQLVGHRQERLHLLHVHGQLRSLR